MRLLPQAALGARIQRSVLTPGSGSSSSAEYRTYEPNADRNRQRAAPDRHVVAG
jgi:hypothetical protein